MGGSSEGGMFGANSPLFGKAVQQNTQGAGGAQYTAPAQTAPYTPAPSNQTGKSPFVQQMEGRQMSPIQNIGLQAIMSSFMNQQQGNQTSQPMQQGIAPYSGLGYRPNMSGIAANLSRVAPVVIPQQPYTEGQTPEYVATPPMSTENGQS
jgi:hypothetical protein